MIVGWLASRVAHSATSQGAQYAALAGFVLAESIIFVPLLFIAQAVAPGVIQSAAVVTLLGFTGLTGIVYYTRKDFSFLGGVLRWAGIAALLLIVAGVIFGFELGTFFSVGMIALAGGAILYDTSNVMRHYPEDRYVGAALELFASVALMFWYVLRLFLSRY
jgi:FtsH-binding integral membrane protein